MTFVHEGGGMNERAGGAELSVRAFPLRPFAASAACMALAVMCGAVASRGVLNTGGWLPLALALVLAGAWAAVWQVVAHVAWAVPAATWRAWAVGQPAPSLPYTQPGSDAANVSTDLGQFGAWVRQAFAPHYAGIVLMGLTAAATAVILAAALVTSTNAQAVLLTLVALVTSQAAALLCKGNGRPHAILHGLMLVTLPFMLGFAVFAPLSAAFMCLALGFGAIAAPILPVMAGPAQGEPADDWQQRVGYGVTLVSMVALRQPFGVFVLGVLWLPQLVSSRRASVRARAGWLIVGLVAASVALSL